MAGNKLTEFTTGLKALARPNRFIFELLDFPVSTTIPENLVYYVLSASIPELTASKIEVDWFGRKVGFPGDPTFAPLEVTFRIPEDWSVVNFFETWVNDGSNKDNNTRGEVDGYKGIAKLSQFKGSDTNSNSPVASYYFHGIWAKTISAVELSSDINDTFLTFSITFNYDKWSDSSTPSTGSPMAGV